MNDTLASNDSEDGNEGVVDAKPTKEFFIYNLVKDIELTDAITDLVDNSVDGARRIQPDRDFSELYIHLDISEDSLVIEDNCGGIELDRAKKYAFRFGRAPEAPDLDHSIGEFGIGMKRALFKIGQRFEIETVAPRSSFKLDVAVEEWMTQQEWEFNLEHQSENDENALDETGTTITVRNLHETVADKFALENYKNRLRRHLRRTHSQTLEKDLEIEVNGVGLDPEKLRLLADDQLQAGYQEEELNGLKSKIYVGVGESSPDDAGWYIFGNGRLIFGANKDERSNWGTDEAGGIPKFHNQYARFRGFVFFDADETDELPWDTRKTTVDPESPAYVHTKTKMAGMMRPVIDFLDEVKKEKEDDTRDNTLKDRLEAADAVPYDEVETGDEFKAPDASEPGDEEPETRTIQYKREEERIEEIKSVLGVGSNSEVGRRTFDYFYSNECEP